MNRRRKLGDIERGRDLSRILTFTDGVFAIAATLLVLQIDVPSDVGSSSELWRGITDQSGDIYAYLISFVVIGFFWISHHRFMRQIKEFDRGLMVINLFYLIAVVLIPFTSQVLGEYGGYFSAVTIYALNMSLVSLAAAWAHSHALKNGLVAEGYEWDVELTRKSNLFNAAYFLTAIPLSLLVGGWALLAWFGLRFDPFQRERDRAYKAAKAGSSGSADSQSGG